MCIFVSIWIIWANVKNDSNLTAGLALDTLFSLLIQKVPNPLPPTLHGLNGVCFLDLFSAGLDLSGSEHTFFPRYLLAFNSPWCRLCPLGGRKEPFVLQRLSLEMSQNFKEKGNTRRSYTCFSHWLKCDLESSKRENIGRNSGSEFK